MTTPDEGFYLGYVRKAHGVRGEIKVVLDVDDPTRYIQLKEVWMALPLGLERRTIAQGKHTTSGEFIWRLAGLADRNAAEALKGTQLYLPLSYLPEKDETGFYYHELPGFRVYDDHLGELGAVVRVEELPAQAVLVVAVQGGYARIPVVDAFIQRIDRATQTLFVSLPEGLIEATLSA